MGSPTSGAKGEIFALMWQDINFKRSRILVRRNYVKGRFGTPKSGKSRIIPLSPRLETVLLPHQRSEDDLIFYYQEDETPLTRNRVKHAFWRALKRAGLRRIDLHEIRDSFASQLIMESRSLKEVQELPGHSDIKMTMKYAHLSPGYLKEAVACLDMPGKAEGKREVDTNSGQVLAKPAQKNSTERSNILIFKRKR